MRSHGDECLGRAQPLEALDDDLLDVHVAGQRHTADRAEQLLDTEFDTVT